MRKITGGSLGLITLIVLMVSGCSTPTYNYQPKSVNISEPRIGTVTKAFVGDTLLKQGNFTNQDSINLDSDQKISWAYTLKSGYYLKHGDASDSGFYKPGKGDDGGEIIKNALADPWQSVQAYNDNKKLCIVTVLNVQVCNNQAQFSKGKKAILKSNSFQQSLIYSGRVQNKINVGYREFSSNVARPAFNNDVEYDLNSSKVIGYKGAKLEVIEATNEFIKYRVIKNFNKAKI